MRPMLKEERELRLALRLRTFFDMLAGAAIAIGVQVIWGML